jgi:hypothetical protein
LSKKKTKRNETKNKENKRKNFIDNVGLHNALLHENYKVMRLLYRLKGQEFYGKTMV